MSEVFEQVANICIDGYDQKFYSSFPKHFWGSSSDDEICATTGKNGMTTFSGLIGYSDGGKRVAGLLGVDHINVNNAEKEGVSEGLRGGLQGVLRV